jgi:hypothetical protein
VRESQEHDLPELEPPGTAAAAAKATPSAMVMMLENFMVIEVIGMFGEMKEVVVVRWIDGCCQYEWKVEKDGRWYGREGCYIPHWLGICAQAV